MCSQFSYTYMYYQLPERELEVAESLELFLTQLTDILETITQFPSCECIRGQT